MEAREVKTLEVTNDGRITFSDGIWHVPSQATPTLRYKVNPSQAAPSCECDDFQLRLQPCKHIAAVRLLLDRQIKGEPAPIIPPRPPRPTYKQDWPKYNAAQVNEKDHFQELLSDLCAGIEEPPLKGGVKGGRPPIPLRHALFTSIFKVYSCFSARRFMSDLREAAERGYVTPDVSYNVAWKCLQRPSVTAILHDLIQRSSMPLRSVDVDFAVDSTGFSTNKFTKWYNEKYGVTREKCEWVKLHCVVGTKTNIITSAFIGDKNAADCPQLKELATQTAKNFTVRDMSGDKAYLSAENLEIIDKLGGTPYIPFRINSVAGNSPLWDRMFHYFMMKREEFPAHYHKRSNVESTFSAVKRMFGDAVRSRTDTSMVNEVLAKLVCFNLTCVIHSWYELGINPVDWGMKSKPGPEEELPAVLQFPRRPM